MVGRGEEGESKGRCVVLACRGGLGSKGGGWGVGGDGEMVVDALHLSRGVRGLETVEVTTSEGATCDVTRGNGSKGQ